MIVDIIIPIVGIYVVGAILSLFGMIVTSEVSITGGASPEFAARFIILWPLTLLSGLMMLLGAFGKAIFYTFIDPGKETT